MSSQFKTFFQFAFLASVIIAVPVIGDKFNKDFGLFIIPGIILFLSLIWYKIFHLNLKNNNSYETTTGGTPASFGWKKQLTSSLIISFIVFILIAFLGIFIIGFFSNSLLLAFPPLIYPIRILALIFLIYTIIRWILAIKYSLKIRENEVARKVVNKQIFILASTIGILVCLELATLGFWGLLSLSLLF